MGLWTLSEVAVLSKAQMTPKEWGRWHLHPWVLKRLDYLKVPRFWIKVSIFNQHLQTMYYAGWGQRSVTTLLLEGGERRPVHPGAVRSPSCVKFLDAQRQALVLKLKTSCTQESSQLLLDIFLFRNEGKFSHFWAILLCQFYKIACNFINIFKRYSFVNI